MGESTGKAPRALQALLDEIGKLEKEIEKCEDLLSSDTLSEEERDKVQKELGGKKRKLRNLKSGFRPAPGPPSTVDPRRHP